MRRPPQRIRAAAPNFFDRGGRTWQTARPSQNGSGMTAAAKADLGTKRICPTCAARFYDLQKRPIECPKCHTAFEPEALFRTRRPRQPEAEAVTPGAAVAEDVEEREEETEEAEAEEGEELETDGKRK